MNDKFQHAHLSESDLFTFRARGNVQRTIKAEKLVCVPVASVCHLLQHAAHNLAHNCYTGVVLGVHINPPHSCLSGATTGQHSVEVAGLTKKKITIMRKIVEANIRIGREKEMREEKLSWD